MKAKRITDTTKILLIGIDGKNLGSYRLDTAKDLASKQGFIIKEVQRSEERSVWRFFGQRQQFHKRRPKKQREAEPRTKDIRVQFDDREELRERKLKSARRFLKDGFRVRFRYRFPRRAHPHGPMVFEFFNSLFEDLKDVSRIETPIQALGYSVIMVLRGK